MSKKNYIFLIITVCMSIICIVRAAGMEEDFYGFGPQIVLGMTGFVMGFIFFGIMTIILGLFFKIVWGATKIYPLFKKMMSFALIVWFVVSLSLFLSTFLYSESIGNVLEQCTATGIFAETWVYKNFLEEKVIESITINKKD